MSAKPPKARYNLRLALFASRFRQEAVGLVYSPQPGGEGWIVVRSEADQALRDYESDLKRIDRLKRRAQRWSLTGIIMNLAIALLLQPLAPLAGLFIFVSIAALFISYVAGEIRLWQAGRRATARFQRRVAAEGLSRRERVRRGYQVGWWFIPLAIFALSFKLFMETPASLITDVFGSSSTQFLLTARAKALVAIAVVMFIGLVIMVVGKIVIRRKS